MDKPKLTRAATSNIAPFGLRMQPELRAQLEAAAAAHGRSMNAEIVSRLEQSLAIDSGDFRQADFNELKAMLVTLQSAVYGFARMDPADQKHYADTYFDADPMADREKKAKDPGK